MVKTYFDAIYKTYLSENHIRAKNSELILKKCSYEKMIANFYFFFNSQI